MTLDLKLLGEARGSAKRLRSGERDEVKSDGDPVRIFGVPPDTPDDELAKACGDGAVEFGTTFINMQTRNLVDKQRANFQAVVRLQNKQLPSRRFRKLDHPRSGLVSTSQFPRARKYALIAGELATARPTSLLSRGNSVRIHVGPPRLEGRAIN